MYKKSKHSIKEWSVSDRPREKMRNLGAKSMTDSELIAMLIGSGSHEESALELSRNILSSVDNKLWKLTELNLEDFLDFKGIGSAKASTLQSALELALRISEQGTNTVTKITSSNQIYEVIKPKLKNLKHEEFWVIFLNRSNGIISMKRMSSGGIHSVVVDPRLILREAISQYAVNMILIHNHPSNNLKPSELDKKLTVKIIKAAELLDIKVLDHLIVGRSGYFSFMDQGLIY